MPAESPGPLTLEDLRAIEASLGCEPLMVREHALRLLAAVRQLQDEALDVAECRRLANVAVDQAEAARAKLRSVMAERDGLRALCDRVREALGRIDSAHDALPVGLPSRSETVAWSEAYNRAFADMRAAIEALGPGGGK